MTPGLRTILAIAAILLPLAAAAEDDWRAEDPKDFRAYSTVTIGAVDAAVRQTAEYLLARQRKDGSWEGAIPVTALAVEALASVEPPSAAVAAAAGKGARFVFEAAAKNDADLYAVAYAAAAVHRRPGRIEHAGLFAQDERLREMLRSAPGWGCSDFKRAVLLLSLRNSGEPDDALVALVKARGRERPAPSAPACAALLPDPENPEIRAFLRARVRSAIHGASPGEMKRAFDGAVAREEEAEKNHAASLGLSGLPWAAVGLTELRLAMVEPKRGCLGTADLLASRLLAMRAGRGDWEDASALAALVHLQYVFDDDEPPARAASSSK